MMRAEIISVGTELLLGDILNTNAQFLAKELAALGFSVYYQTVVGDNPQRLSEVVRNAKERSEVLLLTGGLGPTDDDLTKQTVAAVFGDTLELDAAELASLERFFAERGREMTENNAKQAMVPKRGQKIPNANGTAPGALFRDGDKLAVLMPGPPREMQPMFRENVLPLLQTMQDAAIESLTLRVFGVGESDLENRVYDLLLGQNPTAALYAKTGEVHIRITARAATAAEAQALCRKKAAAFYSLLGDVMYSDNQDDLESVVVHRLAEKGRQVATAESCTGGMLSQRITSVAGASEVFSFGLCSYSNAVKQKMLGVRSETLQAVGAVSAEVACEMACGAAQKAAADYGVGITGIAGPGGGTAEKPVGLVYVAAAAVSGKTWVKKLQLGGRGRDYVRWLACQHALDMLRRLVLGLPMADAQAYEGANVE